MSIKAGRVGVNPSQVNPVDGSIVSSATSGYTKQEADAKFLTQTDAASTYESKNDASTAHNALQPKTLAVPIEMLSGSKLTVETALQGLNSEKLSTKSVNFTGDVNLLVDVGIYAIGEAQNVPANYGMLIVLKRGEVVHQLYIRGSSMYTRYYDSSITPAWSGWYVYNGTLVTP